MAAPAYPTHALIEFGGPLQEISPNDEIWNCGLRVTSGTQASPGGGPYAEGSIDAWIPTLATAISTWFHASTSYMATNAGLSYVKFNNIAPSGKYAGTTPHTAPVSPNVYGVGTQNYPSFTSIAYHWRGARTIGKATRGRMYPPNYCGAGYPAGATHAVSSQMVTAATNLYKAVADLPGPGGATLVPIIVSSSGQFQAITSVQVSNVISVQRRRKGAHPGTFTIGAVAP